jgi:hypothetical protein
MLRKDCGRKSLVEKKSLVVMLKGLGGKLPAVMYVTAKFSSTVVYTLLSVSTKPLPSSLPRTG